MIVIALLLAAIGGADIARAATRSFLVGVLVGSGVFVVGVLLTGVAEWWAWSLTGVLATAGWMLLTRTKADGSTGRRRTAMLAVAGLAVVVVALWGASGWITVGKSVASRWFESLPASPLTGYSLTTFVVLIGVSIFLVESGNVVVRIALSSPEITDADDGEEEARRWLLREQPVGRLKGGRMIGPFERLFILALALGGQFTAIGAIVAAKGIIRFPEISRNDANGSKAEEFLVGSFTSWSLVLAGVLVIGATLA